ncbi:MAG: YicC/YloC family endoribonuclease [Desulfococcaceae bacterium]
MTAFARAEKTEGNLTVSAEIRSYNSRYLDLTLRIPQAFQSLEDKIKTLVSERTARGRVELKLQVQDISETSCAYEIDENKAAAYYRALSELKERFAIERPISIEDLSRVNGIIRPSETETDTEASWGLIKTCLEEALSSLDSMRKTEGSFIAQDFAKRMDYIEAAIENIAAASDGLPAHYQERLKARISTLTQGIVDIDPARIAQEAAFLADRSDISEEIVRAGSHVKQFRAIMFSDESAGRKLNFLLQEFNREFNTMGSKTGNADVSHMIVELKSELEKIREQVQNVE